MDWKLDGWIGSWVDGLEAGWMDWKLGGWIGSWMDGLEAGWMDWKLDGWIGSWVDEKNGKENFVSVCFRFILDEVFVFFPFLCL
jgi:hypothetical protein